MIDEILSDVKHRMDQAVTHANIELNKVRTGRANPEIFDSLVVDYYGSMTPLNQVSTISIPEPRLITLTPYEKTLIPIFSSLSVTTLSATSEPVTKYPRLNNTSAIPDIPLPAIPNI